MTRLVMFPSYRCNDNCHFCIEPHGVKDWDLDIGFARRAVSTVGSELSSVVISGGEPLLSKNFRAACSVLRDSGYRGPVTIETNCTTLTPYLVGDLRSLIQGPLNIMASLHGMGETHDGVVGRVGSFAERVSGITIAHKAGIRIKINTVILPENLDELPELYKFIRYSLDITDIQFSMLDFIGQAHTRYRAYIPFADFCRSLRELLSAAARASHRIALEKIPLCAVDADLRLAVCPPQQEELTPSRLFLMPPDVLSRGRDRRLKFAACNMCSREHLCEGVYPSCPPHWFQPHPIAAPFQ